jgi:hypothetical protein
MSEVLAISCPHCRRDYRISIVGKSRNLDRTVLCGRCRGRFNLAERVVAVEPTASKAIPKDAPAQPIEAPKPAARYPHDGLEGMRDEGTPRPLPPPLRTPSRSRSATAATEDNPVSSKKYLPQPPPVGRPARGGSPPPEPFFPAPPAAPLSPAAEDDDEDSRVTSRPASSEPPFASSPSPDSDPPPEDEAADSEVSRDTAESVMTRVLTAAESLSPATRTAPGAVERPPDADWLAAANPSIERLTTPELPTVRALQWLLTNAHD